MTKSEKIYEVYITYAQETHYCIRAKSEKEAEEKVEKMYDAGAGEPCPAHQLDQTIYPITEISAHALELDSEQAKSMYADEIESAEANEEALQELNENEDE